VLKPPKISIVTPSFNQGEFLEECIDSILSQNYPNLEYIIMDGGSTDNSVEIIKKYEKYLTYWQSKPDKGQYDAINEGFRKTSGEIMAWLNSDDKYHHNAFYKVAHVFTTYPHIEWLTGRHTKWNRNGELMWVFSGPLARFSRQKFLKKDYNDPSVQQESTFWKRSLWEKAGGMIRTDLDYAGDLELWMRFFRHAPFYSVETLLGGYREHGNQKAILHLDRYTREANMVLDAEIASFSQGDYPDLLPAPQPVILYFREIRAYIDTVYASSRHDIFKISDDTETINSYFVRKIEEYHMAPPTEAEEVIKRALVVILQKLGLYNFYVRHEPAFSKVYYFFRRFFKK
jgi:glycosyltransferase involved in cell wall biosynthesis